MNKVSDLQKDEVLLYISLSLNSLLSRLHKPRDYLLLANAYSHVMSIGFFI